MKSERFSRWITSVGAAAVVAAGLLSVGCGAYEEVEYPRQYYVAPTPPTSAELAAQQEARQQAAAENREILIGEDEDEYSDTDPSALTEFKPALEGHGTWVDDGTYGTVWVPASAEVGTDFQPYVSAGHWTYSDTTDYVWVSDYSWGWAPFHYGRWVMLPGQGWAWIPGRRYAGAWVTWRVGPSGYGYVGWAPMAPSWYWYRGTALGWNFGHYHPYDHYVYCPNNYMYQGAVSTHVVRGPAARVHDGRTQDYVAASPSVGGGGRVVANPSVGGATGDRVVASPSVNNGDHGVVANPSLGRVGGGSGGRTAATPVVARGPRPSDVGVKSDVVVAPPVSNPGLDRAQTYAFPSPRAPVSNPGNAGIPGLASPRPTTAANPIPAFRGPASAALVPRGGDDVRSPSMSSSMPSRHASPSVASPTMRPSAPSFGSSSPSASAMSPGLASGPTRSSVPAFRPSPTIWSSPTVTSSPSFRSSPSVSASPSFRSASPSTFSARSASPTIRSSPSISAAPIRSTPSPSFRSSASPAIRSPSLSSAPSRSYSSPTVRSMGRSGRR